MGAVMNGIALHGGTRVYGGTFLVFSDYMRGAVRPGGADGPAGHLRLDPRLHRARRGRPTHQPIEHLASLRACPGLDVVRPADANETAVAWRTILETTDRPAGLCLTRQNVPTFDRTVFASAEGTARGGYVLRDASNGAPQVVLIGTGSEVQICVAAQEALEAEGIPARVGLDALRRVVPRAGRVLQAHRLPSDVKARGVRRGRRLAGLARVGRRGRRVRRDRALRRQRALHRPVRAVRADHRPGRRRGRASLSKLGLTTSGN
jgi:transketolase